MMKDNHVAGEGNAYYTLFREYDPDLGRWWRPDPIFQPWQSPYSAFDGNPIMLTDVWGLESEKMSDEEVKLYNIYNNADCKMGFKTDQVNVEYTLTLTEKMVNFITLRKEKLWIH